MSVYHQIFMGKRYRGASGRLRDAEQLTRSEALHWLAHHPRGAALMLRMSNTPVGEIADMLVEASQRTATYKQREATKMGSTAKVLRNLKSMGEAEFVRITTDVAKKQFPELTRERAFSKLFTADDSEGRALRAAWRISKQGGVASSPLDEPSDTDDETDEEALAKLEALAEAERRRNPGMTKAVAFSKVYCDPANARLAQAERRANRPRA